MPRPRRRPHDNAYKLLFSHPELVKDLLTGYVDPQWVSSLDLSTLERCANSYVSPDLRERRNDIVWRVRTRRGCYYVYLLIEFQSTVDRSMPVRLLGYVALLWQDLIKQRKARAPGLLPPVLPIVLYNGDKTWTAPCDLSSLIAPIPDFLQSYQPQARYLFLDESHATISPPRRHRNLVAAVFALAQDGDVGKQHRVIKALQTWLQDRPELLETLGTWYASVVPPGLIPVQPGVTVSLNEVEPMLATRMLKEIERQKALSLLVGEARGKAKGMAAGKAEGKAEASAQQLHIIKKLVASGTLTVDAARIQVKFLLTSRVITRAVAREALMKLG